MNRAHAQILLTMVVSAGCLSPVQAEPSPSSPVTSKATAVPSGSATSKAKTASGGSAIRHCVGQVVRLPLRLTSFVTGTVVGTPIAVARKWKEETVTDLKSMTGEKPNPLLLVPATPIALIFGTIGGIPEGLSAGMADAWGNSGKKPFSKETFSLGDIKYPQDPVFVMPRWTYLF